MQEMYSVQELERMRNIDIQTVDPATVPEIEDIHINTDLPPEERIRDMLRQMNGNPFVYRCGDVLVKTSFAGSVPLQTVLEDCLEHSK